MNTKRALSLLFLVMFLVMIGFGIIIPVLPFFAENVGATPTELGLLMAVYSLMQLAFAPMWGRVSDRIGRRPVIMVGIAGLALSFFLMAVSTQLWMLFAARIIGGMLSAATMPTTMAYIADITTPEKRSHGMGLIGAAIGFGFIFGPALGGIFSKTSLSTPFYLAGGFSILTLILVFFFLKESLAEEDRNKQSAEKKSMWADFSGPASVLFVLQLFVSLSLSGLEATFAYFAAKTAGMDTTQLGYIFMIMGFASAMVQGGLVGALSKRYGEGIVIQLGIVVSAIGFALILLVHDFATAAIYLSIFGIGNGFIRPSVTSLLTKTSKTGHGSATGLLSSFDSLGRIVGPILGGWLYSMAIGLPYISGVVLSLIALLLYEVYHFQVRKTKTA